MEFMLGIAVLFTIITIVTLFMEWLEGQDDDNEEDDY